MADDGLDEDFGALQTSLLLAPGDRSGVVGPPGEETARSLNLLAYLLKLKKES